MITKLKNPTLLRFLGAVQHHSETSSTLLAASGYDPLELQIAVSAAQDLGLIEPAGQIHPSLRITNAGRAWAAVELAPQLQLLQQANSLLLVGDMPGGAVTVAGEVRGKMRRSVALAGLAFGWLAPVGAINGKVRQFKPTPSAIECTGRDFVSTCSKRSQRSFSAQAWRSSSLEVLHRQNPGLITAEHMRIARDFQMFYLGRQDVTADVYSGVRQRLAPRLLTALEEVCGKSTGLEALETMLKIPARSGKAVVALALETLDHTGALT